MRIKKQNSARSNPITDPNTQLLVARQQLAKAEQLRQQKSLDKAESICADLLRQYPDYYGALHTLGLVCADRGNHQKAVNFLVQAAIQNPSSWTTQTGLAGSYLALGSRTMAAHALSRAIEIKPEDPSVLLTLAKIYHEDRRYDLAHKTFRKALDIAPHIEEAALGVAMSALELGRYEEVFDALVPLTKKRDVNLQTLHVLSQLPRHYCDLDIVKLFDKLRADPTGTHEVGALFARSRAFDKNSRFDEAWTNLIEANKKQYAEIGPEEVKHEIMIYRQRLGWLRSNPYIGKKRSRDTGSDSLSLFVLGPSRSGKTSVEKLLGAHSNVCRGYENPSIRDAVRQTYMDAGLLNWSTLHNLPINLRDTAAHHYSRLIGKLSSGFDVTTNTSPGHIWDALYVNEVIPDSKFVFIERDFHDLAIRIFMMRYRKANYYSYDLKKIEEFIEIYNGMMSLVSERIPDQTLVLKYTDIVERPREIFEKLVTFCGLEMENVDLPSIGDDRGCSDPYRKHMDEILAN